MTAEIAEITDSATGDVASVLVSQGFNCFRWIRSSNDVSQDALWATEDFPTGAGRASSSGIPILFPFPGRLRGHAFTWNDVVYPLEPGDAYGNAIHGFVHNRPWRLVGSDPHRVVGEFQASIDAPELLQQWPSDFLVRAEYQLEDGDLYFAMEVQNTGTSELPFGLGLHPYFRKGVWGQAASLDQISIPVAQHYLLDEMLPTGEAENEPSGLADGVLLEGHAFDDVYWHGECNGNQGTFQAKLGDLNHPGLTIEYGTEYPCCVVYTPPHGEAVCIEPYTCLPNAPEWMGKLDNTGWQTLAEGKRFRTSVRYQRPVWSSVSESSS